MRIIPGTVTDPAFVAALEAQADAVENDAEPSFVELLAVAGPAVSALVAHDVFDSLEHIVKRAIFHADAALTFVSNTLEAE